jgi:hypothetical protein
MIHGRQIENEEFKFTVELDVETYTDKDVFYIMHKLGILNCLIHMRKFRDDKKFRRETLRRDKETDRMFKAYIKYQEEQEAKERANLR